MPGPLRPFTSLMICAPIEMHISATSAFMVSTETGTLSDGMRSLSTGLSLRISSSAETGAEPGRVDSAPTSMTDAPWSAISSPCLTASSGSMNLPPSENESGVTFRIPMMRGPPDGGLLGEKDINGFTGARR